MAEEIRLPQLGRTMEEGTIVEFTVKTGQQVKKGDCIFEIETDKATLRVESPAGGFVKHILVKEGDTLGVGEPVMILGDEDEEISQGFIDSLKAEFKTAGRKQSPVESVENHSFCFPEADKTAENAGVTVPTADTIAEAGLGSTIAVSRLQKLTAERMLKSKREIPCFYLNVKVDVTELVRLRTELNRKAETKLSYNDFIIKAAAGALEKFPLMTGQLRKDTIELAGEINIGLAVSVPDGLLTPVVKNANEKSVYQIAGETKTLAEKARKNQLLLTEMEDGCTTVSNLGGFGIETFTPVVIPGQCSILGVAKITDTCMPDDGGIEVKKLMCLTLSADHKVTNGVYAAEYLDCIKDLLEDTSRLI